MTVTSHYRMAVHIASLPAFTHITKCYLFFVTS